MRTYVRRVLTPPPPPPPSPLASGMYARDNDENYGRPLTGCRNPAFSVPIGSQIHVHVDADNSEHH